MAHNTPLQMQNIIANPKAYHVYELYRKALEDKQGTTPWLPFFESKKGAFKLPFAGQWYSRFDLGIPATGGLLFNKSIPELFSSTNPFERSLLEAYVFNKSAFSGAPISDVKGVDSIDKLAYVMRQTLSPTQQLGRTLLVIGNLLPGDFAQKQLISLNNNKVAKIIFGTKELTNEEQAKIAQFNALLTYLGIPIGQITDEMQVKEIWRRYFELKDIIPKTP
jgi:hypothetical protein